MGYAVSRYNTTEPLTFLMILSSDHITGATGKTPAVTISKNGGAFAAPVGAVSEIGNGLYKLAANQIDADTLGPLLLHATATACDPRDDTFSVVDYNPIGVFPVTPPAPATFGTQSAEDYINRAFDDLGVKAAGETLSSADMLDAWRRLNNMISSWGVQPLTTTVNKREVFSLVASQATYTIGPGGNFDTVRPIWLTGAGLLLTSVTPNVEFPIGILTDDGYESIRIKDLGSQYVQQVYYNPTFTDGLGRLTMWPVPTTSANKFVLYSREALVSFANLTAEYSFPPGYDEAIEYNLAKRLAAPYGKTLPPDIAALAAQSLALIKRANQPFSDLSLDPALTSSVRRPYNILSDT